MATKNIEININNGNGYDVLYPKTMLANVSDWNNSIYSKSQTYSKTEVDRLLKDPSNEWTFYKNVTDTISGDKDSYGWNISSAPLVPSQDFLYKDWIVAPKNIVVNSVTWVGSSGNIYITTTGGIVIGRARKTNSSISIYKVGASLCYLAIFIRDNSNGVLCDFYGGKDKSFNSYSTPISLLNLKLGVIFDETSFTAFNITVNVDLYWRKSPFAKLLM